MIDNTDVEWSFVSSSIGQFLGTSHFSGNDASQSFLAKEINKMGGVASEFRHSHPNMSLVLSRGDVIVAAEIVIIHPNTSFFVDSPMTRESKRYDETSEPGLLQEIIVTPRNFRAK